MDCPKSATIIQSRVAPAASSNSLWMKYAPRSALTSVSVTKGAPAWNAGSWREERSTLGLSMPMDHATLAFNASLGSALSEMMALKA